MFQHFQRLVRPLSRLINWLKNRTPNATPGKEDLEIDHVISRGGRGLENDPSVPPKMYYRRANGRTEGYIRIVSGETWTYQKIPSKTSASIFFSWFIRHAP